MESKKVRSQPIGLPRAEAGLQSADNCRDFRAGRFDIKFNAQIKDMSLSSLNQESNVATLEPKLLGLPRSFAGALIGIIIFLVYIFSFNFLAPPIDKPTIWRIYFPWGLTLPAEVITRIFIFSTHTEPLHISVVEDVIYEIFIYAVSSIPPAFIGAQIFSANKSIRIKGFTWLIIYVILTLVFGWCSWFGFNLN